MLKSYLEYLIKDENILPIYTIIYIAGASQTVDLMQRSQESNLFNTTEVISVLDGDQLQTYQSTNNVYFLPVESIEKYLYQQYCEKKIFTDNDIDNDSIDRAKKLKKKASALYHDVINKKYITNDGIFRLVEQNKQQEVEILKKNILDFLQK
jgi:hypothetical protein